MALSPLQSNTRVEETKSETQPSKTFSLDLDKGEIGSLIDGEQALRQFILKAIETARFRFLIYSDNYGSELDSLIGQDLSTELLNTEIPRIIKDALIYDDRIDNVSNFKIARDGDKVYISFDVDSAEGLINQEVTV